MPTAQPASEASADAAPQSSMPTPQEAAEQRPAIATNRESAQGSADLPPGLACQTRGFMALLLSVGAVLPPNRCKSRRSAGVFCGFRMRSVPNQKTWMAMQQATGGSQIRTLCMQGFWSWVYSKRFPAAGLWQATPLRRAPADISGFGKAG